MKKLAFWLLVSLTGAPFCPALAQHVSLIGNVSAFDIEKASDGLTEIDYRGSTSLSANLRIFRHKKWAFRLGAGIDNLKYRVTDTLTTDYQAQRQDIKGIIGLERHFFIADIVDIYPGIYVPVVVVGEEIVDNNWENLQNGNLRSGLGVVLGANLRVLRIFRVGVEFDANYDHFKETVRSSLGPNRSLSLRGFNHSTALTLGIAF